jgi:hypothetical protein
MEIFISVPRRDWGQPRHSPRTLETIGTQLKRSDNALKENQPNTLVNWERQLFVGQYSQKCDCSHYKWSEHIENDGQLMRIRRSNSLVALIKLVLLLWDGRQVFGFPLHIFSMPISFKMSALIGRDVEDSMFSTWWAFQHLFLCLFVVLLALLLVFDFQHLFVLFVGFGERLQNTGLLVVQVLNWLIDDYIDGNFDGDIGGLLADEGQIAILVGFDVVYSDNGFTFGFFGELVGDVELFEGLL